MSNMTSLYNICQVFTYRAPLKHGLTAEWASLPKYNYHNNNDDDDHHHHHRAGGKIKTTVYKLLSQHQWPLYNTLYLQYFSVQFHL